MGPVTTILASAAAAVAALEVYRRLQKRMATARHVLRKRPVDRVIEAERDPATGVFRARD